MGVRQSGHDHTHFCSYDHAGQRRFHARALHCATSTLNVSVRTHLQNVACMHTIAWGAVVASVQRRSVPSYLVVLGTLMRVPHTTGASSIIDAASITSRSSCATRQQKVSCRGEHTDAGSKVARCQPRSCCATHVHARQAPLVQLGEDKHACWHGHPITLPPSAATQRTLQQTTHPATPPSKYTSKAPVAVSRAATWLAMNAATITAILLLRIHVSHAGVSTAPAMRRSCPTMHTSRSST